MMLVLYNIANCEMYFPLNFLTAHGVLKYFKKCYYIWCDTHIIIYDLVTFSLTFQKFFRDYKEMLYL